MILFSIQNTKKLIKLLVKKIFNNYLSISKKLTSMQILMLIQNMIFLTNNKKFLLNKLIHCLIKKINYYLLNDYYIYIK